MADKTLHDLFHDTLKDIYLRGAQDTDGSAPDGQAPVIQAEDRLEKHLNQTEGHGAPG